MKSFTELMITGDDGFGMKTTTYEPVAETGCNGGPGCPTGYTCCPAPFNCVVGTKCP